MEKIVFLDEGTIGPGVQMGRPRFQHEWVSYDRTAPEDRIARLKGASIAITNKVPLCIETIAALPDLRFIAVAATGYDVIDVEACRKAGISVANIRGYAVNSVPEHTFALITALRRNITEYRTQVLNGEWIAADQFCFFNRPIWDLAGSTLGIIGAGTIGQAVARIGKGFGMNVVYHTRSATSTPEHGPVVSLQTLRDISDVVSCHCPLNDKTRGLIDANFLAGMKQTAILINTARGGIVDEEALAAAIQSGQIAGAGLDVTNTEPAPLGSTAMALAQAPNVILTPHVGWASIGAMQTLFDQLIENIEAFVQGTPQNLVT